MQLKIVLGEKLIYSDTKMHDALSAIVHRQL